MRILLYVLAGGAGLIATLGLLRAVEQLLVGEGVRPAHLLIVFVAILLAVIWVKRARAIKT